MLACVGAWGELTFAIAGNVVVSSTGNVKSFSKELWRAKLRGIV
jgi:hypothetical protein